MKEKLIQLLEKSADKFDKAWLSCKTRKEQFKLWWSHFYVDDLIDNGVLAPPCKVGDKVFFVHESQEGVDGWIDEGTVTSICYDGEGFDFRAVYESGLTFWHKPNDGFCFFNKSEAEKAL